MIYIDDKGHMVTNEMIFKLHRFAEQMGLERTWHRNRFIGHHYKVKPELISKAILLGAINVRDSKVLSFINKGQEVKLCGLCDEWDSELNFIRTFNDGIICRKCSQKKEI